MNRFDYIPLDIIDIAESIKELYRIVIINSFPSALSFKNEINNQMDASTFVGLFIVKYLILKHIKTKFLLITNASLIDLDIYIYIGMKKRKKITEKYPHSYLMSTLHSICVF